MKSFSLIALLLLGLAVSTGRDAFWIAFASHMTKAAVDFAKENNIGKIFLTQAVLTYKTLDEINSFNDYAYENGVEVHFWVYCFYDDGEWLNPINTSTETYNQDVFDDIIARGKKGLKLNHISGLHLDYVRYGGNAYKYDYGEVTGTKAVSEFVRQATKAWKEVNPKLTISAAIMPEKTDGVYYYGQDVTVLGQYLDVIVPMAYKGNYYAGRSWIVSTCQWYAEKSEPAAVWCGLQTYNSDDDPTPLSASEMNADVEACIDGGLPAVAYFRYGLLNL